MQRVSGLRFGRCCGLGHGERSTFSLPWPLRSFPPAGNVAGLTACVRCESSSATPPGGSVPGAIKPPIGSGHIMLRVLLIVDDDENISVSMTELLAVEGYSCLTAPSGSEGLRLLESERPLLVILELRLLEID